MRHNKNSLLAGKVTRPSRAEGTGVLSDLAGIALDFTLQQGIPFLTKKGVEAGRYYASEALRYKSLQKRAINFGLRKATPVLEKVGSELLDQLSTKVRPNIRYKTDRPDLDVKGVDIHSLIGKLPAPKGDWTLPGHHYTGPYNSLDEQLSYNPEPGEILEIFQKPTGPSDAVAMQHDVDYTRSGFRAEKYGADEKKCKHVADRKMVKALDVFPRNKRQ